MDDKKAIRIRHYCKSLKLPTWDVNDLTRYVSLYFDDPYSVEFMVAKTKIPQIRDFPHEVLQTEEKCAFD